MLCAGVLEVCRNIASLQLHTIIRLLKHHLGVTESAWDWLSATVRVSERIQMNKLDIESKIESLITRLCSGVIAYNQDFRLVPTLSGSAITRYEIACNAADVGRILGVGGQRFQALKRIMRIAGERMGRQMMLSTVREPLTGKDEAFERIGFTDQWPKKEIQTLLRDTVEALIEGEMVIELREEKKSAVFVVRVGRQERDALVSALPGMLNEIFTGIGVTHGCQLSIDVVRE